MPTIKKIINDPKDVVAELLDGLVQAYHGKIKKLEGVNALVKTNLPEGKVGLFLYDRPDDRLLKNQEVLDCFRGIHFTEVQMDATSHVLAGRGYVGTRPR